MRFACFDASLRRFVYFACLVTFGFVAPALAECKLQALAVLPIADAGAPMVFDASVNGHAVKLRLDTGSDRTTLDLAAANRLGVAMHMTDNRTYGLGGSQTTSIGHVARLQIGGMAASDWQVRGLDLQQGTAPLQVDGYVGMDLLANYDLDIDVAGGHVIIFKADGGCGKTAVALAPPLYAIPLTLIDRDMQADVDVIVDGSPVRALLDTSVRHSFMFRSAAHRLGVDLSALAAPGHGAAYGMGPREVAFMPHAFASVQVGPLTFNNMQIRVIDQKDQGIDRHRTGSLFNEDSLPSGHEMVLGADFMRKAHVWISNSSHQLVLQYPPQASVLPQ